MVSPTGYLLCGTPRTGSTLLCSLLASTGVLGRPESWFREPDEASWARRLGVPADDGRVQDYATYVRAVRAAGTTGNGVFGARMMWGSLDHVVAGLGNPTGASDSAVLEAALGPLAFVHLRREDVVGQAVSWSRAEQTGFWQQGDAALREPQMDVPAMEQLVRTVREHDAAWQGWFDRQQVEPVRVTYEQLVRDPRATVEAIADRLQVVVPATWRPVSPHRKQADRTSDAWAAALRARLSGGPEAGSEGES